MKLLVLAYPELTKNDFEKIQDYRKDHDSPFHEIVRPHFTLVFPITEFSEEDFTDEIHKQLVDAKQIRFVIRCATVNKNAFHDTYHTFLVPDEGYSDLVKLHDTLYSGRFSSHLRLDLDFIPHISIGNSIDKNVCKKMADAWNKNDLEIKGTISTLDIVRFDDNVITTIERKMLTLPSRRS